MKQVFARPLLNTKHHSIPIYTTENVQIKSPKTSFNYYSFIKLYLTDMFISAFIITPLLIYIAGAWDYLIYIYYLQMNV